MDKQHLVVLTLTTYHQEPWVPYRLTQGEGRNTMLRDTVIGQLTITTDWVLILKVLGIG